MLSSGEYRTLEEAVSAELRRLIAATELALREAAMDHSGGVRDEERWGAVTGALTGISHVIIGLAQG